VQLTKSTSTRTHEKTAPSGLRAGTSSVHRLTRAPADTPRRAPGGGALGVQYGELNEAMSVLRGSFDARSCRHAAARFEGGASACSRKS